MAVEPQRWPDPNRYLAPVPPQGAAQPSLGHLFSDVGAEVKVLVAKEVQLAKTEIKEQAAIAGKAGAMFGATAVIGFIALMLVAFAAAWGLAELLPAGLAFLIVAVVFGIIAALCLSAARRHARQLSPVPTQTIQTIKSDIDVAKNSFIRGMHSPLGYPHPTRR